MRERGRDLPELWGGVECTVNRVGDRWFDQLRRNGHRHRLSDLDRFAALGLNAAADAGALGIRRAHRPRHC